MTISTTPNQPAARLRSLTTTAWEDLAGGLLRSELWGRMGWLDVKRRYNRGGWLAKRNIEAWYVGRQFLGMLRNRQNPFAYVWGYKRSRGMSYYTDVKDWVGGWPMEFSSIQEVKDFARDQLDLELINITTGEANTEYLFSRAMRDTAV